MVLGCVLRGQCVQGDKGVEMTEVANAEEGKEVLEAKEGEVMVVVREGLEVEVVNER